MDKLKQWVALTVVGVLVVLAAGWFLLVSPKRNEASDISLQATQKQSDNRGLATSLALLKSQAKDLPAQQAKLAVVAAKIPDNPALPALIRALDAAAATADVELVSLAPSVPVPFVEAGVVQPIAPVAPAAAAGAAPGAAVPVAPPAVVVQQIPVALNVVGGYFQVEQFLDRLENLTRAFKVTGFTLAPGSNPVKVASKSSSTTTTIDPGKSLSATINGQVFLKPAAVPATAPVPGAAAAAPAK